MTLSVIQAVQGLAAANGARVGETKALEVRVLFLNQLKTCGLEVSMRMCHSSQSQALRSPTSLQGSRKPFGLNIMQRAHFQWFLV
jgi:hypothetical protein